MPAIPFIMLAVAVVGTVQAAGARKDAKAAANRSFQEQKKAAAEQKAAQAQQAAQERRNQIREERVRRAKVMQGAENTGTSGSSGEYGAISSLSTQLGANLGFNKGQAMHGNNISIFNQNASQFNMDAQNALNKASNMDQVAGIGMSGFNASGGFGSMGKTLGFSK